MIQVEKTKTILLNPLMTFVRFLILDFILLLILPRFTLLHVDNNLEVLEHNVKDKQDQN